MATERIGAWLPFATYILIVAQKGFVMRAPGKQPIKKQAEEDKGGYERGKPADPNAYEAPSDRVWQWLDAVWWSEISGVCYLVVDVDAFV